jgi:hypothetical protein
VCVFVCVCACARARELVGFYGAVYFNIIIECLWLTE